MDEARQAILYGEVSSLTSYERWQVATVTSDAKGFNGSLLDYPDVTARTER
jgi:hypothetical protein